MIFQNNKDLLAKATIYFKGGSSGGNSIDYEYNSRMAAVAEAAQGLSNEQADFWRNFYKPMEQEQTLANRKLIPYETEAALAKLEAEKELLPGQTALTKASNESALRLIPGQESLTMAEMKDRQTALTEKAPVRTAFFKDALTGVDVNARANRAAADAVQSFDASTAAMGRNAARMGVSPNSGRFAGMLNTNTLNRAKLIGGAKTQARTQAENENFQRLTTAMGY